MVFSVPVLNDGPVWSIVALGKTVYCSWQKDGRFGYAAHTYDSEYKCKIYFIVSFRNTTYTVVMSAAKPELMQTWIRV